jgi:23S rRNA (uracil1939-C5)-methyltransferase
MPGVRRAGGGLARGEIMGRLRKGEQIEVDIDDLAYGGKGVGRLGNLVVMVAGGLPGDRVRARVTRMRRTLAEALAEEVVRSSTLRREAFCSHNPVCGGCRIQEMDYPEQVRVKARQVEEALRRIGGFESPPMEDPLPAPETRYYRNKMEFSFGADPEHGLRLGLHPAGDFRDVFPLEHCYLLSAGSNDLMAWVLREARATGLPAYDQKLHQGFYRFLTLREGKNTGQTMVVFTTTTGDRRAREALVDMAGRLQGTFPEVRSVVRQLNDRRAGVAAGEAEELLAGERTIQEELLGYRFEISARSFFQTNTVQAKNLYGKVLEYAAPSGQGVALDMFSGTGTIAILLSDKFRKIFGVESNPDAISDAVRNAELNQVTHCEFVQGEAREALDRSPVGHVRPEVVVVNPPRAGVHASVLRKLVRMAPQRVVYVSCNPTTLARDLEILAKEGYRFRRVVPVDMFPHTAHVESVALMER